MTDPIAAIIDHTALKPETTEADVDRLVREAVEHGFAAVCVNGRFALRARRGLDAARAAGAAHAVRACAVAGFPLGATLPMAMAIEATQCCKAASGGADEVDVVAFLPHLLRDDRAEAGADALRDDLLITTRAVRAVSPSIAVKVILETAALKAFADARHAADSARAAALWESMIEAGCRAAREAGCDFVKTSTGFHPAGGATADAVRLLRRHAGPLKVKASGGVRTRQDALRMIDAGADRLGTSSGVDIAAQR